MKSCVRTSLCLALSLTSLYPAEEIPVKEHWLTVTQAASVDWKRADFQIQNPGPGIKTFVTLESRSVVSRWFTQTFSLFDRVRDKDEGVAPEVRIPPHCTLSGSYDLEKASKGRDEAGSALRICVYRLFTVKEDGRDSVHWAPETYSDELSPPVPGETSPTSKSAKVGTDAESKFIRLSQACSADGQKIEWQVRNLGGDRVGRACLEMEDSQGAWIEVSGNLFEGPSAPVTKETSSAFYDLPNLATFTSVYACADIPPIRNASKARRVRIAWHPWGKHSPPTIRSAVLTLPAG